MNTISASREIYLDNCCTSFPKAPGTGDAMRQYIENVGVNIARGGYARAYDAAGAVIETRMLLDRLLCGYGPRNTVFTAGATMSLNIILKGFLRPGDHVLVSSMEHNAVMRPLTQLAEAGVNVQKIPCFETGEVDIDAIPAMIVPDTRAIVMTHASNVCGTVMPIETVGEICRSHGIRFIVDAAQTAGAFPIDMKKFGIHALALPGHKSLLGPQGIGAFLIDPEMAKEMTPLVSGGTGSFSDLETVPETMPDKFECGTQNLPGIMGLKNALEYLEKTGSPLERELELTALFMDGIREAPNLRMVGLPGIKNRAPVVSVDFLSLDNGDAAYKLESEYGIMTRCGLHCAPSAHRTLGTFPHGTVRFSMGHATTEEEVLLAAKAVCAIASGNG